MQHTIIMKNTYEKQVLTMLAKTSRLRSCDLKKMHILSMVLTRMTDAGVLERVARGLYRQSGVLVSEKEELITVAKKVPKAVFCLLTALRFHELTTQPSRGVWIAMPQGSHAPVMDYPFITMVQLTGRVYSAGIETAVTDKVTIKVYSPAKTVVDCFKFRNKIGLDVAIEALKDAIRKKKVTLDELYRFAKIEQVLKIMQPYMEIMG